MYQGYDWEEESRKKMIAEMSRKFGFDKVPKRGYSILLKRQKPGFLGTSVKKLRRGRSAPVHVAPSWRQ